ncbi:unnamed protein product [Rotaria socialis]|uniref:Uncharacterized protein n=2 Tax=Rotaria socialis TaxID=392032 RepID=A0A820X4J8_9BILA|nr:unnamed protein product [Rotaria socialis]CAF4523572.1 unnamed protein product [Rotaria socialis]
MASHVVCSLFTIDIDCSKKVSYYCRGCLYPLASPQQSTCTVECSMNNRRRSFRNVSELVLCDVKKEISSTAKRYVNLIQEYQNQPRMVLPGDVLNGQIYRNLPSNKSNKLTLMLHADGAPVTKVGGKSLWPIQCTLVEIPPPMRDRADATMILGAWLGGTHPNRDLLWCYIVQQIHDLFKNGIIISTDAGEKLKFNIRAQYATFDLPALAQNCNIIQFNGYDAYPDCDIHGIAIGRQVFYPYSATPAAPKTDHDYTTLSIQNTTVTASKGIKGPTPLTKILVFPDQIAIDYMHLVCSGHFKTLITYWEKNLLPGVFDQSSNYLISIILPHSFRYQFIPLVQYSQWKTKMFRDFLLYISPVFACLFLPDTLALPFIHYFLHVRALYAYDDITELNDIENIFNYYYEHIVDYYGEKSQLCTLHLHSHLKEQVLKHGALVYTSCFARESYIGHSLKWCLGKNYILEQFITWYKVDRSLASSNSITLNDIFNVEKLDETYTDKCFIQNYQNKLITCSRQKKIDLTTSRYYSRYSRGFKMFHSRAYTRGDLAMDILPTSYNRVRRSTAGINKRFDEQEYVLVSFPQWNKHSIVPSVSIDIDPLDKQNGSIKTFGSRKNLRIVSTGPKEVMKERASRYAVSAASEEVELVPDEQENNENQDDNYDDDDYSPSITHRMDHESKKRITTGERSKSRIDIISPDVSDPNTTTSSNNMNPQKTPLCNRELNFSRVYTSKVGTKRCHEDNHDESSLSGTDISDDEYDKDLTVVNKSNELQSLLKKPRLKRKKKVGQPVSNVDQPCNGCKILDEEIKQLRKRVDQLEKVIPVIKKFRSKTPITPVNQSNSVGDINGVYANIERVTGINPNQIKSTPNRPTMIMRELIKKCDRIGDKTYLKEHESLFKEFIQMKCIIIDDNMSILWKEIMESLSRQHIDEENNKKKRINKQPFLVSTNTTSQLLQTSANLDGQAMTTAMSSEPPQST